MNVSVRLLGLATRVAAAAVARIEADIRQRVWVEAQTRRAAAADTTSSGSEPTAPARHER